MIKTLLLIALIVLFISHNKYYIETNDRSIQGYIEYMKDKYYKKKD